MLRYHSGRNRRSDQNGGFDHILFESREWYWIPEFKNGNNINPDLPDMQPIVGIQQRNHSDFYMSSYRSLIIYGNQEYGLKFILMIMVI